MTTSTEVRAALEIHREQSVGTAIRRKLPYLVERTDGSWKQCPWLLGVEVTEDAPSLADRFWLFLDRVWP